METTRLAPSPTGALHLGNARTFLINWFIARQSGWRMILRIEDMDGPRVKAGADQQAIADLNWLGITWDDGPVYQSSRRHLYSDAVERLVSEKKAYPCVCSRREAELAGSAPHAEDGAVVYPGTCRGRYASIEQARLQAGREPAIRFSVPARIVKFTDQLRGVQLIDMAGVGDFVIQKNDGTPAYQLAVVVDDAEMRVTEVVRGDDLLESAARQILLYKALGWGNCVPRYWHLPLVTGHDGRRLAKRHGDTRVASYRESGVAGGRILALLARWSGVECGDDARLDDLLGRFDPARLPRQAVVFTDADHKWLMQGRVSH